MIHAVPAQGLIYAYVDPALIDPMLIPTLESIGDDTTSLYDWRPDGPAADPVVELRMHRVRQVSGSRLAVAEIEPGVIHLSVDRSLIALDLAQRIAVHATQLMRLMQ
ncbi:hypothetical protein [Streptosporangium sp. NPDC006007]|uniref:hypothetical protein n=1 Tax=Streptosporangium sp. NPDC006007 TaxID=3154575 RepID=UPI0033A78617